MNNLIVLNCGVLTMTSREIAELTGKRHDNVMDDCRKLAAFYAETYSPEKSGELVKSTTYKDSIGRTLPCFELNKDASLDLVTGYSLPHRHAVNQRWQELEDAKGTAIPQTYAQALRAHADAVEAKELAEEQARIAIATKAQIGSRREASSMATASAAVRKAQSLERELDRAKDYATVKRMQMLYHGQRFNWRLLRDASAEMGITPIDVFDANYGTVKAYHADVWMAAYALDIAAE